MPTTRPAIRAKMGSTIYYETVMRAQELAAAVRPANETERWATMSIDERMQREPNWSRIRDEIVPYLANHPDRFFGSLIVLVPKGSIEFEPLEGIMSLPAAYRAAAENVGFLTFGKGEHVALDGQHRLLAFKEVISPQKGEGTLGQFQHQVADDEVCVLVIEHESDVKTRRIFNKVNRHAKPTGASDNIITSEDDGYAIVTRRLLDPDCDGPLAARKIGSEIRELVEWQRTSLGKASLKLTTIAAVYETVRDILAISGFGDFSEKQDPVAPPPRQLDEAFEIAADWWRAVLGMPQYVQALDDPDTVPAIRFSPTHSASLLLRVVGQISLFKGLTRACSLTRKEIPVAELVRRAALVDWSPIGTNYWRDVIVKADGRMNARREAYELAAELLTYLIAPEALSDEERHELWFRWNRARGKAVGADVDQLEPEEVPQDLPKPVGI